MVAGKNLSRALMPGKTRQCCHAARKHEMFLPYSKSKFCFLETKLTLETMFPVWQNWETLGKHARATGVSGNMFPRFARPLLPFFAARSSFVLVTLLVHQHSAKMIKWYSRRHCGFPEVFSVARKRNLFQTDFQKVSLSFVGHDVNLQEDPRSDLPIHLHVFW